MQVEPLAHAPIRDNRYSAQRWSYKRGRLSMHPASAGKNHFN